MPKHHFHVGFKWVLLNVSMTSGKIWGGNNYTKFRVLCHFFYDTSDDKLINIFIPIYFLFIHFWYILHPNIDVMNLYHRWLKFGWKKQFVSENTCNFYNVKFFLQGMTTDTKFTFSVGDATHAVYTKGHFARRLRACDHCTSSTLIGGKGSAGSKLASPVLRDQNESVNASWM